MTRWEVTLEVPLKLPSLANARLHWSAKARIIKAQRQATALALRTTGRVFVAEWARMAGNEALRLGVLLTRVGPRRLDDDNLASAFKAVRDQVAAELGVDDGSARYEWRYHQQPGPYAVRIRIEVIQREVER